MLLAIRHKDRHAIDQKRARKLVDNCSEHFVEIGFSVELSPKFDQCVAVVVASAVEEPVDSSLNPFSNGIKKNRDHENGEHEARRPRTGNSRMNEDSGQSNRSEVNACDRRGGECVRHAALENKINVHQTVTNNRVTEGQRQNAKRDDRQLNSGPAKQERHGVKHGEGHDRKNCAASDPFQLLAQNWAVRNPIAVKKDHGRRDEVND